MTAGSSRRRGLPPAIVAVLWFCGTMLGFAGMAVSARELHTGMSAFEILFFRSFIGVAVILPVIFHLGFAHLRTGNTKLHFGRAVVQIGGQYCFIYGVTHLSLSDLIALEFTVPIWTALLAVLFLGERMFRHKMVATAAGFVGVLIILRPGAGAVSEAALVVLFGSALYALSGVLVKFLTRTDSPQVIVFYMNLIQLPMGLIPALVLGLWVDPAWEDVPVILVWGLSGIFAHYTMARALQLADITLIFPLDFLRLPFMALIGWMFYAEILNAWTAVGALVIFAGNWHSVAAETRRTGAAPVGH